MRSEPDYRGRDLMCQEYIEQTETAEYRFNSDDFEPGFWASKGGVELQGGRGGSMKIEICNQPLVLHRYLRGGMIAKLLDDQYLWNGLHNTRPFRERIVVQHAQSCGLPVPDMLAFQVRRNGIFYRAACINQFISNTGTLADAIGRQPRTAEGWEQVGRLIRKMHDAGINHVDLNANNILVDTPVGLHLIDFDKAVVQRHQGHWRDRNIQRLLRSLHKIQARRQDLGQTFHFSEKDWNNLLRGYK